MCPKYPKGEGGKSVVGDFDYWYFDQILTNVMVTNNGWEYPGVFEGSAVGTIGNKNGEYFGKIYHI